jgi:hypothetical protein
MSDKTRTLKALFSTFQVVQNSGIKRDANIPLVSKWLMGHSPAARAHRVCTLNYYSCVSKWLTTIVVLRAPPLLVYAFSFLLTPCPFLDCGKRCYPPPQPLVGHKLGPIDRMEKIIRLPLIRASRFVYRTPRQQTHCSSTGLQSELLIILPSQPDSIPGTLVPSLLI